MKKTNKNQQKPLSKTVGDKIEANKFDKIIKEEVEKVLTMLLKK